MALNEIARHFYEKEVERLLELDDVKIIKEKFLDMLSQIDDLYVELGERARRIAELKVENKTIKDSNFELKERILCSGASKIYVRNEYGQFDLDEINKGYMECRKTIDEYNKRFKEQKEQISELENELSVKENLLKIKNALCNEKSVIEILKSTPFVEDVLKEEPLPFSDEQYEEETKVELPTMPIDVASMLINARNGIRDKYSKDDLQEIIEHLRAFVDNPSDD